MAANMVCSVAVAGQQISASVFKFASEGQLLI
jgi:hypothetical protein